MSVGDLTVEELESLDWGAIGEAVSLVSSGKARHVRGDDWAVYRTASVIRLDLDVSQPTTPKGEKH